MRRTGELFLKFIKSGLSLRGSSLFSMSHKLGTNSKLINLHDLFRVLDKGFALLISYR